MMMVNPLVSTLKERQGQGNQGPLLPFHSTNVA